MNWRSSMKSVFYSLLNQSRMGSSSLRGFWDAPSQTLIGGKSLAMCKTWERVGGRGACLVFINIFVFSLNNLASLDSV